MWAKWIKNNDDEAEQVGKSLTCFEG